MCERAHVHTTQKHVQKKIPWREKNKAKQSQGSFAEFGTLLFVFKSEESKAKRVAAAADRQRPEQISLHKQDSNTNVSTCP